MKKVLAVLAAVAFVAAFAAPALSAEWSFYGSARMSTFWTNTEFDKKTNVKDDKDLEWYQQGNSRFGARVSAGDISGRVEMSETFGKRLLWGQWDFGGGKLLLGQDYTPVAQFYSNQVYGGDENMLSRGGFYASRKEQIKLKLGGFSLAFLEVNRAGLSGYPTVDTEASFPKIEADYVFKMAGISLEASGGYQTYKVKDAAGNKESVDSYVLGIGGKFGMGAFSFWGNYWFGRNAGNFGLYNAGDDFARWDAAKNDVIKNNSQGFIVGATFKISDMLTFEGGWGMNSNDIDIQGTEKDKAQTYYVNAVINIAKGFFIVPEIGVVDDMDDFGGNDEGKLTYFGAKWQINF